MIRVRLLASFVLLLATALTLGWLRYEGSHSRGLHAEFPLPPRVDRWVAAQDKEFDEQVLSQIEADAYAMRFYQAEGDTGFWVYVGMYGGRAGFARGAHDPEVCFPAQGWEVLSSSSAVVPRGRDQMKKVATTAATPMLFVRLKSFPPFPLPPRFFVRVRFFGNRIKRNNNTNVLNIISFSFKMNSLRCCKPCRVIVDAAREPGANSRRQRV